VQGIKQSVSRKLALRAAEPFWQERYYNFNVWSERKRVEKLRYIHRNPVTRGLCADPHEWPWSSFRHYGFGEVGTVEIESRWTAQRREAAGINRSAALRKTPPKQTKLERGTPVSTGATE
jgi:putative transposase